MKELLKKVAILVQEVMGFPEISPVIFANIACRVLLLDIVPFEL